MRKELLHHKKTRKNRKLAKKIVTNCNKTNVLRLKLVVQKETTAIR